MLDETMQVFDREMRARERAAPIRHPTVVARRGPTPASVASDDPGEPIRRPMGRLVPDNLTGIGAKRLADQIRQFWAAAGFEIQIEVIPMAGGRDRTPSNAIRSDMIGRLPRRQ